MRIEVPVNGIGITFSHKHLNYLSCVSEHRNPEKPKIIIHKALDMALRMGFSHLRLGSYWPEAERTPGEYDFSVLEELLSKCEKTGQKVIMNLGVKSPFYPEFYWPQWLQHRGFGSQETRSKILRFNRELVGALSGFKCITDWQVENESFDPTHEDELAIPFDFLKEEVELVRSLDSRPILLTLWAKAMRQRALYPQIFELADKVGLDIYYRGSGGSFTSSGPEIDHDDLRRFVDEASKPVMITELQAEPWEIGEKEYLSENPKSISPLLLESNFEKASTIRATEILFWGFEYWYYRAIQGDTSYLNIVQKLLKPKSET